MWKRLCIAPTRAIVTDAWKAMDAFFVLRTGWRWNALHATDIPGVLPIAASKHGPRKVLTGHGSLRRPLPLYKPLGRRMPVRREHSLHISGLILDGLVPTDAAMRGAEGGHGLD